MRLSLIAPPFKIPRAPLRIIRPLEHPAFNVLATRGDAQHITGLITAQTVEFRRHAQPVKIGLRLRHASVIRFMHRVSLIGDINALQHSVQFCIHVSHSRIRQGLHPHNGPDVRQIR